MVAYKSLKTKEKSSWVTPKVVAVAYGSFPLQSFKSHFKWELRLYLVKSSNERGIKTENWI